ncbi:MAG: MlaD family protein [Planctomycetota bacterium]|jgi:phospholipid/cholesterol/gamma-HCH transport system substrate-binding protein|nr:MlaD family protein [Planctomycetota bacterium]
MSRKRQTAGMAAAIGAAIVASAVILIVMLILWGNSASFLGRHYRVVASMPNVGGLKSGAPVKIGGFQIGRVSGIHLTPGQTLLDVIMDIDESHPIPRLSTAKISTAGLVGDAFMEIVPGPSRENIRRAYTVEDAERLESDPLPDFTQIMARADRFAEQLSILTENVNDIIGEEAFRRNVKQVALNMEALTREADMLLRRSEVIVENVDTATRNIAAISGNVKDRTEALLEHLAGTLDRLATKLETAVDSLSMSLLDGINTANAGIAAMTDRAVLIADRADAVADSVRKTVENLDGGITDIRKAVDASIGNPDVAADIVASVKSVRTLAESAAGKSQNLDRIIGNVETLSENLRIVSGRLGEVTGAVDPAAIREAINRLSASLAAVNEVVERIRAEPVLALSINKAADRIVKMKFDEMGRQQQFRSADASLDEINRWVREAMRRGRLDDPAFDPERRPYLLGE